MALIRTDSKHYENIAAKLREKLSTADTYRPEVMADSIEEVYTHGYNSGYDEGVSSGESAGSEIIMEEIASINNELEQTLYSTDTGGKSFYDAFWDEYQSNGTRLTYTMAFAGIGWTTKTFKPKYDIKPKNARYMFANGSLAGIDLTSLLEGLGIVLDTSNCTDFRQMFYYSSPKRIPAINTVAIDTFNSFIYYADIETIDRLILREDGSQAFVSPFSGAAKLINIIIEGTIGKNGFDIKDSIKLSKASIESIINALSTTTTGLSITLSKTAVNNAFTTDEWAALISTRSNWTISLI